MRTSNRVVLVVAAAVAIAGPALAGGQGPTPSSTPPGFSNSGGHKEFETYTSSTTTTTEKLPGGWDEGKGTWKAPLQSSNPVLTTSPVGHGHR